ncbi:hypothetical protein F5I97DRAFT_1826755 [Phlebopus sp. FC_14]|nr:hypothetical protein F5I97DRAFT_1826755 [Phlebopus sp. FC_14]
MPSLKIPVAPHFGHHVGRAVSQGMANGTVRRPGAPAFPKSNSIMSGMSHRSSLNCHCQIPARTNESPSAPDTHGIQTLEAPVRLRTDDITSPISTLTRTTFNVPALDPELDGSERACSPASGRTLSTLFCATLDIEVRVPEVPSEPIGASGLNLAYHRDVFDYPQSFLCVDHLSPHRSVALPEVGERMMREPPKSWRTCLRESTPYPKDLETSASSHPAWHIDRRRTRRSTRLINFGDDNVGASGIPAAGLISVCTKPIKPSFVIVSGVQDGSAGYRGAVMHGQGVCFEVRGRD